MQNSLERLKKKHKIGENRDIFQTIMMLNFSGLLSVALVLQRHVVFTGNNMASYTKNYWVPLSFRDPFVFLAMWMLVSVTVHIVFGMLSGVTRVAEKMKATQSRKYSLIVYVVSAFCCILPWLLFWLTFFPGTAMSDNMWILRNPVYSSTQHTFLYNMLYSGLFNIGTSLGGHTYGAALFSGVQILYCALIMASVISWLYKKGCPVFALILIQAFFSFSPEIANIVTVALKDTLFSFTLLLFIPLLYDAAESNGRSLLEFHAIITFVFASAMTILIRNNGIYVMACVAIVLLICFRRYWKSLICLFLVAVIAPAATDKAVMKHIVRAEKQTVESLAVPIQQMAMTVVSDGEITEEQWKVIDNIMPREEIIARYAPCSIDALKWGEGAKYMNKAYVKDNLGLVIKTWAQMLPNNLSHYMKAYLLLTHGYWALGVQSRAQAYYWEYAKVDAVDIKVDSVQIWPDEIQSKLVDYYKKNTTYKCSGNLLWMILFLLFYVMCNHRKKKAVIFVPFLTVWFTLMISVPINICFRYNYSLYLAVPFLLCLSLWDSSDMQRSVEA